MNRSLRVLLFLLFLIVYQANAQIRAGVKAGINWNSFRGNKAFDVIPGWNAGVFGRYQLLAYLTAKGEILYSQQGGNLIDYTVLPGELDHHLAMVKFNTVQVPLIFEFGLPSLADEPLQPKISVGAFYSYNFYSREQYQNVAKVSGYESVEYPGHDNASSQWQKNQYGFIGALGADVQIMKIPVYLEFRYTHNLNAISNPGMTTRYNLKNTFNEWGSDKLYIGTLSFNVAVTLATL
jgi:hypothetical protein